MGRKEEKPYDERLLGREHKVVVFDLGPNLVREIGLWRRLVAAVAFAKHTHTTKTSSTTRTSDTSGNSPGELPDG